MTDRERPGDKYVIDTNIVIGTMQGIIEVANFMEKVEVNQSQVLYSVIVEAELFSSHLLTEEDKVNLRQLLNMGEIIDVDSEVALKAAQLRALSRELCQRRMKLPDALVAATAVLHSATLVTRNIDDFKHLRQHGLRLYNPLTPSPIQ